MTLSLTAFNIRIYLRSLTFQEILVFSFYWPVVEVFSIASMRDFNGVIVFVSIIFPRSVKHLRKKVIYPGLLSCFRVVISDDIFLRQ